MDHKAAYALHIAQAIRHKKAMVEEPAEEALPDLELGDDFEELPEEPALDDKTKRRERLKAILSR